MRKVMVVIMSKYKSIVHDVVKLHLPTSPRNVLNISGSSGVTLFNYSCFLKEGVYQMKPNTAPFRCIRSGCG